MSLLRYDGKNYSGYGMTYKYTRSELTGTTGSYFSVDDVEVFAV